MKGPSDTDILLKLLFHLPLSYPSSLPNISLHSEQLTRTQCLAVRTRLLEEAASHLSQPMVHELILWIKQNFQSAVEEAEIPDCSGQSTLSVKTAEDNDGWTALLHLDHMRAKGKYIKTVEKWCRDLGLAGRLMFMGKMIFVLLQGDKRDIKVQALLFVADRPLNENEYLRILLVALTIGDIPVGCCFSHKNQPSSCCFSPLSSGFPLHKSYIHSNV